MTKHKHAVQFVLPLRFALFAMCTLFASAVAHAQTPPISKT